MVKDYSTALNLLQQALGEERVKLQQSLDELVLHPNGAIAEGLTMVSTVAELSRVLELSAELRLPVTVIGAGSKVVVNKLVKGLVVKNRSANLKIIAFKGKWQSPLIIEPLAKGKIGIDEATVEVDSGVILSKLNQYLENQGLQQLEFDCPEEASIGGAVFSDPKIRAAVEKLKVWQRGEVVEVEAYELSKLTDIVLSVIFKLKAVEA